MDMDFMIEQCEKKRRKDEVIVFAIGAGRIVPKIGMKKEFEAAFKIIKNLDGFIGVHPVTLWKTLLIFDTLNHAKSGKNLLKLRGIEIGEIVPLLIPAQDMKGGTE